MLFRERSTRRHRLRRTVAGVVGAGLAIAACGSDDEAATTTPTVTEAGESPTTDAPDEAPTADEPDDPAVETAVVDESRATDESDDAGDVSEDPADEDVQRFPDVLDATATFDGETWTVSATLSSPYDTPERYADSWRVIGPDGTVYGERFLFHDHQNEQPFTRSESGIVIPDDVDVVTIEGRDQQYGWGGGTFELTLER